jgi:hypothetical protein
MSALNGEYGVLHGIQFATSGAMYQLVPFLYLNKSLVLDISSAEPKSASLIL